MSPGAGTGDPVTGVLTQYESLPFFTSVWLWDDSASAYVDHTWEARTSGGTAFEIMAEINDILYLGSQSKFRAAISDLATNGNYGNLTWNYYNGSWTRFLPSVDYEWEADGYHKFENLVDWTALAFSATSPHAAAPPDTDARYWVSVQSAASVTTAATVNRIECVPLTVYTTPTKVYQTLQLPSDFSSTTVPTRNTVEDLIQEAQHKIDDIANQSWQWNDTVQELNDFQITGFKMRHEDVRNLYSLQIWNGGSWETLSEGRSTDYFYDSETGLVFFARYFMLPARFANLFPFYRWGYAEFKLAVRTTYTWGRDFWTDKRAYRVERLATKMVGIQLLLNHDYTKLFKSGIDRVSLDRKIDVWREEIENELEEIRRIVIY